MSSNQKDFLLAGLMMAFCAAVGCFLILTRPDLAQAAGFLFGDEGFNLLVSGHLFKGEMLYRDLHYPYGPIPPYAFMYFSKIFGNTMQSYNFFHLALCVPAIGLAYFLLRRSVSASTAFFVTLLGLVSTFLTPGSPLGWVSYSAHTPFDRLFLLGIGLLWQPPEKRSFSRAVVTGLALGLWQGIKFGGPIFAATAFLLLDLAVLVRNRADRAAIFQWIRWVFVMSAVFLGVEVVWILLAYSFLPPAIAWGALFPAYHLEVGKATLGKGLGSRWIAWGNWPVFIGHYLIPVSALLFCFFEICCRLFLKRDFPASPRNDRNHSELFFYLLFYGLGAAVYFQHSFTFRSYMWMLVLPAACLLDRLKPFFRSLAFSCWLPGFLLMMKIIFVNPVSPGLEALSVPSGEQIWLNHQDAQTVNGILDFLNKVKQSSKENSIVLFMRLGAGFHHFYKIPHLRAQVWLTKGHVRPYDEEVLRESIDQVGALVVEEQKKPLPGTLPGDPCSLIAVSPFSPDLCQGLAARLVPHIRLESGFWLFAEKPAAVRTE